MSNLCNSELDNAIRATMDAAKPRYCIETGTYHGEGTTAAIMAGLPADGTLITIEANPRNHVIARLNWINDPRCICWQGLSVPNNVIPSPQEVERDIALCHMNKIRCDFSRARPYMDEMCQPGPAGLLFEAVRYFTDEGKKVELVLLDSAGPLGFIEFAHLLPMLTAPCIIILDDTKHIKHWRTVQYMEKHRDQFEIIRCGDGGYGWLIANYTPAKSACS